MLPLSGLLLHTGLHTRCLHTAAMRVHYWLETSHHMKHAYATLQFALCVVALLSPLDAQLQPNNTGAGNRDSLRDYSTSWRF